LIGWDASPEDEAFEKLLLAVSRKLGRPRPRKNPQRHALLFGIGDYDDATTFPEFGEWGIPFTPVSLGDNLGGWKGQQILSLG